MHDPAKWEPASHPVHRLIHLHDAAVLAFLSLQRRAKQLQHPFKQGEDGDFPAFMKLVSDYREVMARIIFVVPGQTDGAAAEALRSNAVAWFLQKQRLKARKTVNAAAASLAECWQEPTGEELGLGPSPQYRTVFAYTPSRSPEEELRGVDRYNEWTPIRKALLDQLEKAGECVPDCNLAQLRVAACGAILLDGGPLAGLPSQADLLDFVTAAEPPSPPKGEPPAATVTEGSPPEGGKPKAATPTDPPKMNEQQTLVPKPQADGPSGGCWVWWKGKRHDVPTGNVYKLIDLFWTRDSAHYDDIDDALGDPHDSGYLKKLFSKANAVLKGIGIPWHVSANSTSRTAAKKDGHRPDRKSG